jgi:hypothetical protein
VNDTDLGQRLARRLDACVDDLDPRILRRLQAGRELAIDQLREPATALAATGTAGRLSRPPGGAFRQRLFFPAAVLLLGLVTIYAWQGAGPTTTDGEELELLGDELPINAYLDKGFQQWITPAMQR